ncbi:MAG: RidA family protein [Methanomassiliicoccales archaeon]|nr:RidA family protein [Methanomassiliicoccales archaeon]
MRKAVFSDQAPTPVGLYSQAIMADDVLFVSGQLGIDPSSGKLAGGGVKAEAIRCLENVKAILSSAGLEMTDIVKVTIFMTDISRFKEVNEAYATFFHDPAPARSTIGVVALPLGAKVEIEAIAVRARPSP